MPEQHLIERLRSLAAPNADKLGRALAIGELLLDEVFDGDLSAFSSKSSKVPSLRSLAEAPGMQDLGLSRRTLGNYVRLAAQARQLPPDLHGLHLSHREKLLPLPPEVQVEVGRTALAEGWSAHRLGTEVRRHSRSRRDSPPSRQTTRHTGNRVRQAVTMLEKAAPEVLSDRVLLGVRERLLDVLAELDAEATRRGHAVIGPPRSTPHPAVSRTARVRRTDGSLTQAYLPESFCEVVGNQPAVELLTALAEGRSTVPVLLHGPPGTGKTTLARIYLRSLVCDGDRPLGYEPCEKCETCARTREAAKHAMLGGIGTVAAASSGDPKQAAADVLDELQSPWDGLIVNEADRLLIQQHRLLGIMGDELPIPTVFTTTNLGKFDDQFTSRCKLVPVEPIPRVEMLRLLIEVAASESVNVPEAALADLLEGLGPRAGQARDALIALEALLLRAGRASNS